MSLITLKFPSPFPALLSLADPIGKHLLSTPEHFQVPVLEALPLLRKSVNMEEKRAQDQAGTLLHLDADLRRRKS